MLILMFPVLIFSSNFHSFLLMVLTIAKCYSFAVINSSAWFEFSIFILSQFLAVQYHEFIADQGYLYYSR